MYMRIIAQEREEYIEANLLDFSQIKSGITSSKI